MKRYIIRFAIARSTHKFAKSNYAVFFFIFFSQLRNWTNEESKSAVISEGRRNAWDVSYRDTAFGIRRREIEDCVIRGGWERTLSGQSGISRGTRRRDKRGTAEGRRRQEASVAEILRREPISLIMRSGKRAEAGRAVLTSSSLFLASIYFV